MKMTGNKKKKIIKFIYFVPIENCVIINYVKQLTFQIILYVYVYIIHLLNLLNSI